MSYFIRMEALALPLVGLEDSGVPTLQSALKDVVSRMADQTNRARLREAIAEGEVTCFSTLRAAQTRLVQKYGEPAAKASKPRGRPAKEVRESAPREDSQGAPPRRNPDCPGRAYSGEGARNSTSRERKPPKNPVPEDQAVHQVQADPKREGQASHRHEPSRGRGGGSRGRGRGGGRGNPGRGGQGDGSKPSRPCYYCGKEGHWGDECEEKRLGRPSITTLASLRSLEALAKIGEWKSIPSIVEAVQANLAALRNHEGIQDRVDTVRETFREVA